MNFMWIDYFWNAKLIKRLNFVQIKRLLFT